MSAGSLPDERPIFVEGIGPPLSQIRQDYNGPELRQGASTRVVLDVLALIDAVERREATIERQRRQLDAAMQYVDPKDREWIEALSKSDREKALDAETRATLSKGGA